MITIKVLPPDIVTVEAVSSDTVPDASLEVETAIIKAEEAPIYGGAYEVIPKAFQEQILKTKNTKLLDDITVEEIPYSEVSNPSGGYTVSIAS